MRTGLRAGEKLKEELFYDHENIFATSCDKIKRTSGSTWDWTVLCARLEELRASMNVDGAAPVRRKLKEIVPQYSMPDANANATMGRTNRFQAIAGHD